MNLFERAEKFRADVKQEGKLEGERIALLLVVASRRIALDPEQRARISECDDALTLQRWLQNAATASTSVEVFASRSPHPDAE